MLLPLNGETVEDSNGWTIDIGEYRHCTCLTVKNTAVVRRPAVFKRLIPAVDPDLILCGIRADISTLSKLVSNESDYLGNALAILQF